MRVGGIIACHRRGGMDHRVGPVQDGHQCICGLWRAESERMDGGSAQVILRLPCERHNGVARRPRGLNSVPADKARCSGDDDPCHYATSKGAIGANRDWTS